MRSLAALFALHLMISAGALVVVGDRAPHPGMPADARAAERVACEPAAKTPAKYGVDCARSGTLTQQAAGVAAPS